MSYVSAVAARLGNQFIKSMMVRNESSDFLDS